MDIVNNCPTTHKINHIKIIEKILKKIPFEYTEKLCKIIVFCEKKNDHRMDFYFDKKTNNYIIQINIGNESYNKYPFFSEFLFNIDFILKINRHVEKALKPYSNDPNILMHNTSRIKYKWMHLGNWNIVLHLFHIITYPISKIKYLRRIIFRYAKKIMEK